MPASIPNKRIYCDDHLELVLTNESGEEVARTKIDRCDMERVCRVRWRLDSTGYARNSFNGRLHRYVLGAIGDEIVDHISFDKLDNRRANLRLATSSQNIHHRGLGANNTSGAKGVRWHTARNKWQAYIGFGGKWKHIGYYKDFQEAVEARDRCAKEVFGDFAYTNAAAA